MLPVVGVGASAGGLAATSALLQRLGASPGMAVVLVHHRDPGHDDDLVELLSRTAPLSVEAVVDGTLLEPNRIYVAPFDARVTLRGGRLHLTALLEARAHDFPIDWFLESLAADRSIRPMGVVLSGTGLDGAAGIRAIKARGGATFAQDASAEHTAMPDSAVATGCVDFVLSPEAIARELARNAASLPPLATAGHHDPEFRRILAALRRASQTDFAHYRPTTLHRRVQRRLAANGLASWSDYAALVEQNAEEAAALCDDFLIHVTSFFRDPEVFLALRTSVFPVLLDNRTGDTGLRVWIPGCSSGEEVYSLAISLLELLTEMDASDTPVKLFGTDVSGASIEKARAGKYPASIARDVSPERLQRFFSTEDDGQYQIRKEVRELCVFATQDTTRDPPFAGVDLITCRNMMTYLEPSLQDRILPLFHYALKDLGFLVLGTAESVRSFPGFVAVDAKNRIYARTTALPRQALDMSQVARAETPDQPLVRPRQSVAQDVHREVDRLVLAEFGPPGLVVNDELAIVEFRGRTGPFLEPVAGTASFHLLRLVREELRQPLRDLIDEARATQTTARSTGLVIGPVPRALELEVIPFRVGSTAQRFFVVLFCAPAPLDAETAPAAFVHAGVGQRALDHQMAQELESTRDYLQSVIEKLEAANEELIAAGEETVSSNEELRSTNEEVLSAKESLQESNQELSILNAELRARNEEATRLNDDLSNVLRSVAIPIMILDREGCIRRFTPPASKLFRVSSADIGRPLAALDTVALLPELPRMVSDVLTHLKTSVRRVRDHEGRWYQLTVLPYVTVDNRIDGTTLVAIDIEGLRRGDLMLEASRKYAESIVDTIRECLVVLSPDGRILSGNRAFLRMVGATPHEIEGRYLYDLGDGDWNIPELRKCLGDLGQGDKLEGFRVDRKVAGKEVQTFLLNACWIDQMPSILLAMDDVTDKEDATQKLRDYRDKLRKMAFDATLTEERERRRIAVDVHDHVGQALALAQIKLTSLRDMVPSGSRPAFAEAVGLLEMSIDDLRTLIFDLSPPVLYDLGLRAALSWLLEDFEKRHGVHIELDDDGADKPLDNAATVLIYRAVREFLANILKHAGVATATVTLRRVNGEIVVEVGDKGSGFDAKVLGAPSSTGGFGLFSVREQIDRLGGNVQVTSAPGEGTHVSVRVPLKLEHAPAGSSKEPAA